MEKPNLQKTEEQVMKEFIARGFTIIDDTVYSSEVEEHQNDLCPCCNKPLGKNILTRIKFSDTGEKVLLHRYHSMK
ncbi:MAG: hypothetical protein UR90_C0031G0004 [Parcubacteria group bacterium GW2011_GWC1_35_8]|uniref:Uncharacterized protein n=1 Tax=Candidatus Nomurabacteria bacterium GW2011_GWC2_35_8 TaxID=1618752 RepID=A0A0G0DIR6_9BACT|nr:MAG: hypothetical protein UR90_C0031G0004 [Parcubacteria group bacterium GW2011_GWC1_35_8]KKP88711.1 MAG: hypothetical protein UR91_C0014G0017 [Candidatus Nomurabacteria bacterium GW2011_GWC2_35_8]